MESNAFFLGVEYLAIVCCGLVCGLVAVRKQYGLFAILVVAWLTALGGGVLRNELLGIQLGGVDDPHNWMWKVC